MAEEIDSRSSIFESVKSQRRTTYSSVIILHLPVKVQMIQRPKEAIIAVFDDPTLTWCPLYGILKPSFHLILPITRVPGLHFCHLSITGEKKLHNDTYKIVIMTLLTVIFMFWISAIMLPILNVVRAVEHLILEIASMMYKYTHYTHCTLHAAHYTHCTLHTAHTAHCITLYTTQWSTWHDYSTSIAWTLLTSLENNPLYDNFCLPQIQKLLCHTKILCHLTVYHCVVMTTSHLLMSVIQ